MPIPSRVLASGNPPNSAQAICGDAATGLIAVGTTQTDALQLSAVMNTITNIFRLDGPEASPCEAGALVLVYNLSGQTLKIYTKETSGVTMNAAIAGSTGVSIGDTKTAICFGTSATTWAVTAALSAT